MKQFKRVVLVAVVCLSAGPASLRVGGAAGPPLLGILQSELQRNLESLKKEPSPPYFVSYAVHDERTTGGATLARRLPLGRRPNRAAPVRVRGLLRI